MLSTLTGVNRQRLLLVLGLLLGCAFVLVQLGTAGPAGAKSVTYAHKTFKLSEANQKRRLTVSCPGRLNPLGGGVSSSPAPDGNGEGVYPHSFERLGVQNGFHST